MSDDDLNTYLSALECPVTFVCQKRDREVPKSEARRAIVSEITRLRADNERLREALRVAETALLSDPPIGPQKSVYSDDVIYHLDGQTVGCALRVIRGALLPLLPLASTADSGPLEAPK